MKPLDVRQQTAVPAVGTDQSSRSGSGRAAQLDLFEVVHAGPQDPLTARKSPPGKQREERSD